MSIITKMERYQLAENQIALVWLGQAGFVVMNHKKKKVAIDPYLSHCGERIKNFIRLSAILVEPQDFLVDAYLVTHKHFDHFDYDGIPLVAGTTEASFFGPSSCVAEFDKLQIQDKKMNLLRCEEGAVEVADGFMVKAVYADHGQLEPDAIGLVLQIGNVKIYVTGDTAFRPEKMNEVKAIDPDIMIASINGEFGNLTPETGAQLAVYAGAKTIIPCHFWTFLEHKGRPDLMEQALNVAGDGVARFLTPGNIYICEKNENGNLVLSRM